MGKMRPSWMRWMDELGVGPGRRAVEWLYRRVLLV